MSSKRKDKTIRRHDDSTIVNQPIARAKPPVWKQLLFTLITVVALFAAVEIVLVVVGVRPVLYDEDPYVGFSSYIPLFVEQTGPDGKTIMATAKNKLTFFNRQQFAANKPSGTYRIFCAGGSTTFGRPYDDVTSFCVWLRAMLPKADPSRKWELINVGGVSYASYRVAVLMEELVRYEPDLFIIYSGHNEFLERRTYGRIVNMPSAVRGLGAIMSRTRTYTVVKRAVDALGGPSSGTADERAYLPGEVETILENSLGPEEYHRDAELQRQVLNHYRYNLVRMVDIARSVGAKVVLVTPASNLRHCSPFKSEHRDELSDAKRKHWQSLFDHASETYAAGQWDEALKAVDEAITIDDRYAHAHYLRACVLWELERYDQGRTAFARAMDEDVCPLRALRPMLDIIIEVANERDVPVVDFAALVELESEHATPGENLFLDHVHPTIEGNRRLALALLEAMNKQGIVHFTSGWGDARIRQVTQDVENRLDSNAHGIALRDLSRLYRWAGKFEEGRKLGLRATQMVPTDAEAHLLVGANALELGRIDEAISHFRQALQIKPDYAEAHSNLGDALAKRSKFDEAISHYLQALQANPNYSHAYCNLGVAMSAKGRLEEAVTYFRRALRIKPDDADSHNGLGSVLVAQGRLNEAIDHFRRALQAKPDYVHAHCNLGYVLRSQGKLDEAITHFHQALQVKPDYVYAYCGLGATLQSQGKLDEAINCFHQALHIKPDCTEAHSNLGDALSEQGRLDEAISHYSQALQADPDYAHAHCNLGVAMSAKGEFEEAVRHFRQALQITPDYTEAHNNLGSVLVAQGRLDDAISHYRQALRAKPDYLHAHRGLDITLQSQAGLDKPINRYSQVLQVRPDYAKVHHNLGRALIMAGELAGALEHFREAARLKPNWPTPLNDAARILATHPDPKVQDASEAIRFAERAAELTKYQNVSILDTLAVAYAAAGRFDKAVTTMQAAITLASAAQADELVDDLRKQLELYRQAKF
jgi:tetratricopeptide (TPR) repeat protein